MKRALPAVVSILAIAFVIGIVWVSMTVTGEETMTCEILEEVKRHTSRRSFGYSVLTSCGKFSVQSHLTPFLQVGETYLLDIHHKLLGGSVIVGYAR